MEKIIIIIKDTHLDNTTAGSSSVAHILPEKERARSIYHATLYSPSKEKHRQLKRFSQEIKEVGSD